MHGLYAITDSALQPANELIENVEKAIVGGAKVIQYRDKSTDQALRLKQARELVTLCSKYQVPLLINDDVALALECGADGVHLGKDDASVTLARQTLGQQAIIGVSCYNQWNLAVAAAKNNVNYIAFGRFFRSQTKPDAASADLGLVRQAKRQLPVSVVAIGGITPENGGTLIDAGADTLAVVQGVFGADDITAAARQYAALFEH